MRRVSLLAALLLGAAAICSNVHAQPTKVEIKKKPAVQVEYSLDKTRLAATPAAGGATSYTELGCEGVALREHKGSLYVACGFDGLLIFALDDPLKPRLLGRRDFGGAAVEGLFLQDERVWARVSRAEALPVSRPSGEPALSDQERVVSVQVEPTGEPAQPVEEPVKPVEEPVKPAEAPVHVGSVVEVGVGQVVIDFGADQGIKKGDRIELYTEESEDLGGGQAAIREDQLAVAEAFAVSEHRAKLKLGVNEAVPAGTLARKTSARLTGSTVRPPRVSGLYETQFMVRPFLALGDFGFGMVSDASVGLRTEQLHIAILLEPAGVGLAKEGNIVAVAGNLVVAYDTQMFEVGLGIGWSAVNDAIEDSLLESSDAATGGDGFTPPEFERVRSGFSIAQVARLGALDGFNLKVHNAFLVYEEQFNYGGTTASVQVPVGERSWLIAAGGGGVAGYAYGELGLRVLVTGNGGQGSIFITPSVGGAGLFGEKEAECEYFDYTTNPPTAMTYTCSEEISYGGPMIGFGMEFRN